MDREVALESNHMYNSLFEHNIVSNQNDFQDQLDKIKKSNLRLNGKESGFEVNKMLVNKLNIEKEQIKKKEDYLRSKLQSESDKVKEDFVKALAELGVADIEKEWFRDFSEVEFKEFTQYIRSSINRVDSGLLDPIQNSVCKEVLDD